MLMPLFALAQTTATSAPITVATVNIYDAKIISQQGNAFTVSFELSNRQGEQPGVRYAVELLDAQQNVADQDIYPAVLDLNANATIPLTVRYTAPSYLSGTYQLELVSDDSNGLPLAQVSLGNVTLSGSGANVQIVPSTCYLTVVGDNSGQEYSLDQGVDIAPSETLDLTCAVQNNSSSALTLTPSLETFYRNVFGSSITTSLTQPTQVSVGAGKEQTFTLPLPKASEPQAYDVQVSFTNASNIPSNSVIVHYVLDGASATIQNLTLDGTSYQPGQTAQVTLFWTGPADDFPNARAAPTSLQGAQATVRMVDANGNSCGPDVTVPLEAMQPQQVIPFTITAVCVSPRVSVTLADDSGATLASSTFAFTAPSPTGSSIPDAWIVVIALVILIIGGYVAVRVHKRKKGTPVPSAMLVFLFIGAGVLAGALPQHANADTYTENVYLMSSGGWQGSYTVDFTANLDNDVYLPGATITASGNANVGTCGNSLYADEEATVNGQTQQVTSNYQQWSGVDYVWGTQPSPSAFTAQTIPGTYDASFYYELGVPPSGPGAGSVFCNPEITSSCQELQSFTATQPYNIPYTVGPPPPGICPDGSSAPDGNSNDCTCSQGNLGACSGVCPDGSAAPGGDASECSCAQGNINACSGTGNNNGASGSCADGAYLENGTCVYHCDAGYSVQSGQCVFTGCSSGYTEQADDSGNPECVQNGCSGGYICHDGSLYYENSSCVVSSAPAETCSYGCAGDACALPPSPEIASWNVEPTLVASGETTNVQWQAENVASCAITGTNGDSWTGLSGSETSSPITGQTIYTIACTGFPGADPASASDSTTVKIAPQFEEQ